MTMSIRKVRTSDLQAIVQLDEKLFGEESFSSYSIRQFINLFPESFFVAEQNELLVGYAVVGVKAFSNGAWLLSMGVSTPHQKCGIGTTLLAACDDYCKSSHMESCRLSTSPSNSSAISLYRRFGFEAESELRNYNEPGDHKLIMLKAYISM